MEKLKSENENSRFFCLFRGYGYSNLHKVASLVQHIRFSTYGVSQNSVSCNFSSASLFLMCAIREMERKTMKKIASNKRCLKKAKPKQVLRVQVISESVALSMGFMLVPVRSFCHGGCSCVHLNDIICNPYLDCFRKKSC